MVKTSLYFESFMNTQKIEIELLEGEQLLNAETVSGGGRLIWIMGTPETAAERFKTRND